MFSKIEPPSGSGKWASVWPVFSKQCFSFVVCKYFTVKVLTNKGHLCSWHAAKLLYRMKKVIWHQVFIWGTNPNTSPFLSTLLSEFQEHGGSHGFLVPAGEFTWLGWVLGLCRMLKIGSVRCMAPNAPPQIPCVDKLEVSLVMNSVSSKRPGIRIFHWRDRPFALWFGKYHVALF